MIYAHLFTSASPIYIWGTTHGIGTQQVPGIGLLRACKQLHSDTELLPYTQNVFLLQFQFQEDWNAVSALRNVVAGYSEDDWSYEDGVDIGVEREHFPIQKVRSLKMELEGPGTWPLDQPVYLAKHLHTYLHTCINNCANLKHLHIELKAWYTPELQLFCTDLLLAQLQRIQCSGLIKVRVGDAFRIASVEFPRTYETRLQIYMSWYGDELGYELGEEVDRSYEARIMHILSKWTEKTVEWI